MSLRLALPMIALLLCDVASAAADAPIAAANPVVWRIDSLESIGGHRVTVVGKPRVVEVAGAKAVAFDGVGDGLFVDGNPLVGLTAYTVEVVFRPTSGGPFAQRFIHFQPEGTEDRLLFETRLPPEGRWFLDTYLKSDQVNQTLFADKFLHPLDTWHHAAITVDAATMRHYVDGKLELSAEFKPGTPQPAPLGKGRTSLGMRFNQVHWYKGEIRELRVTPKVLKPEDFSRP
jgi:hypothetical protein